MKWAEDDPNPGVRKREASSRQQTVLAAQVRCAPPAEHCLAPPAPTWAPLPLLTLATLTLQVLHGELPASLLPALRGARLPVGYAPAAQLPDDAGLPAAKRPRTAGADAGPVAARAPSYHGDQQPGFVTGHEGGHWHYPVMPAAPVQGVTGVYPNTAGHFDAADTSAAVAAATPAAATAALPAAAPASAAPASTDIALDMRVFVPPPPVAAAAVAARADAGDAEDDAPSGLALLGADYGSEEEA